MRKAFKFNSGGGTLSEDFTNTNKFPPTNLQNQPGSFQTNMGTGGIQKQSDWLQEDENAIDYIKNKPQVSNVQIITWEAGD